MRCLVAAKTIVGDPLGTTSANTCTLLCFVIMRGKASATASAKLHLQ